MGSLAVFGLSSDGANLAISLLLLTLVVFWLALVYWTYSDARRRIEDPMLIGCATAASLFPFAGTIVYVIVRPPEFLDDIRERELEIAAAEARLASMGHMSCPYCNFEIEQSFLRCPSCLRRLKEPCGTCGKPLDPRWKICPYCEADIRQAAPQRLPQRRRAAAPSAQRKAAPVTGSAREAGAAAAAQSQPATRRARQATADGSAAPAGDGSATERPRSARQSAQAADRARPQRAPTRQKRATRAGAEKPVTDGNAAEQPARRPRTRPPSAG